MRRSSASTKCVGGDGIDQAVILADHVIHGTIVAGGRWPQQV